jgi:hypothetical protein
LKELNNIYGMIKKMVTLYQKGKIKLLDYPDLLKIVQKGWK